MVIGYSWGLEVVVFYCRVINKLLLLFLLFVCMVNLMLIGLGVRYWWVLLLLELCYVV